MRRIRGLPNDQYRERKEAISRTLKDLYDGIAADPLPPEWLDRLDKAARNDA